MKPIWYTDGACSKNGSSDATGGFGVVCIDEDTSAILYQRQINAMIKRVRISNIHREGDKLRTPNGRYSEDGC